jgi:hypothetical protein
MINLIIDRLVITVVEHHSTDTTSVFQVYINSTLLGEIELLFNFSPSLAINGERIAIWGGERLYLGSVSTETLHQYTQDDEIQAVYSLVDGLWCIVRETSVVVFDENAEKVTAYFWHDEIFLKNWWTNECLNLQDLQGKRLTFCIEAPSYDLRPV